MLRLSQEEADALTQKRKTTTPGKRNPKKSKYRNKKVYVYASGIAFAQTPELGKLLTVYDSIAEYRRGEELALLEKSGAISNLERQVALVIQEAFTYQGTRIRAIVYKPDFRYVDGDGNIVIEDVKGYDTRKKEFLTTETFRLKWKLLKRRYPEYVFLLHN